MNINQEKIKCMNIIIWEHQKQIEKLQKDLIEKEQIIEDLKAEIILSDREVNELNKLVNNSNSVDFMLKLMNKIQLLSTANKELIDINTSTANLFDYEYCM